MMSGNEVLSPENMVLPVKKGQEITAGEMVAVGEDGYVVSAVKDRSITVVGVAQEYVDARTAAEDGAVSVCVKRATFLMGKDETVAEGCLLKPCYVADAGTVSMTADNAPTAGLIVAFYGDLVAVDTAAAVWPFTTAAVEKTE